MSRAVRAVKRSRSEPKVIERWRGKTFGWKVGETTTGLSLCRTEHLQEEGTKRLEREGHRDGTIRRGETSLSWAVFKKVG